MSATDTKRPIYVGDIPGDVLHLFEKLTLKVIAAGKQHYSADAILHRIRWHYQIEKSSEDFKCNDHWTRTLSRWFMEKHPAHAEFFTLRACRTSVPRVGGDEQPNSPTLT